MQNKIYSNHFEFSLEPAWTDQCLPSNNFWATTTRLDKSLSTSMRMAFSSDTQLSKNEDRVSLCCTSRQLRKFRWHRCGRPRRAWFPEKRKPGSNNLVLEFESSNDIDDYKLEGYSYSVGSFVGRLRVNKLLNPIPEGRRCVSVGSLIDPWTQFTSAEG